VIANVLRNISKYWKSESFVWFGQDFKTGFDALNADTFYHILPIRPNMTIGDAHRRAHRMDLLKQLNQEVKHRMGPISFGAQHQRRKRVKRKKW